MHKHKKNLNYYDLHVLLAKYYSCMSGAGNKFKFKFRSTAPHHFLLSALGHFQTWEVRWGSFKRFHLEMVQHYSRMLKTILFSSFVYIYLYD